MCTIDGLYSNSSYEPQKAKWVWLKEAALNFAIALIVGALSAAICYGFKGSDLDLFYKMGGGVAAGIFLFINFLTILNKPSLEIPSEEPLDVSHLIQSEQSYSWQGKQPGEILPNLFVANNLKPIKCDYEIRLRVHQSSEPFPTKAELQSKWDTKSKIIYYDVAQQTKKGLFKLQAHAMAEFIEKVSENGKKVLFTGVYDSHNQKVTMKPLQTNSPFVDVGVMVAHYLMQKTECSREEILSFLGRELTSSYSNETRVYNGHGALTLSLSPHINAFIPENAGDFECVDISTIALKTYQHNQTGFKQMKADLQELLDLADAADQPILQRALDALNGSFDAAKMTQAKSLLKQLPY